MVADIFSKTWSPNYISAATTPNIRDKIRNQHVKKKKLTLQLKEKTKSVNNKKLVLFVRFFFMKESKM